MRILLLSDIHANLVALETVLRVAPAHEAVWCLGDVVGYGPHPNECVARLRELDALTLTGNHDQAALGNVSLDQFRENARLALEWTQHALTAESAAWLTARAPKQILMSYDLTLVHASPRDPIWEYIEHSRRALENFAYFDTGYCFFGHTHQPRAYHLRVQDRVLAPSLLPEGKPYALAPKLLLNPGSVGQPRDCDPRAAFGIFDTDRRIFEPHRVEYDIAATQRAMTKVGLPAALVARLAHGT